jgi:hypothetical protein
MSAHTQNYKNHAKFVPAFHFFVLPVMLVNVVWSSWQARSVTDADSIIGVLVALALLMVALLARMFALKAQDRVIRLEMRLRMRELLPAELLPRVNDFTVDQLVALRFASDAELPELAATVLRDDIQDRKSIKQMVKDWQGDFLRV